MKGRIATPSVVAVLLVLLTGVPNTNAQATNAQATNLQPTNPQPTIPGAHDPAAGRSPDQSPSHT